jgi:hypothetical protein
VLSLVVGRHSVEQRECIQNNLELEGIKAPKADPNAILVEGATPKALALSQIVTKGYIPPTKPVTSMQNLPAPAYPNPPELAPSNADLPSPEVTSVQWLH